MLTFVTISAGSINALPNQPEVTTLVYGSGTGASAKVPQEVIYEALKMWEAHWDDVVVPAFAASSGIDPTSADSVDYFAQFDPYPPLHAGAVQYYKERDTKYRTNLSPQNTSLKVW